jgi:PKD domain
LARSTLCTGAWRRALVALCLCTASIAAAATTPAAWAAAQRSPTQAPSDAVIDGPSPDIQSLNGMSMSRDGTGALVYLRDVLGVPHVFVSRLAGGVFQTPVEADAGLIGASSQPVIASGQGGLVLVAFVNGGTLYVAQAANAATPLSAPAPLATGAINPSLSISNYGKAYLAFTGTGGAGGGDVRSAYYFQGQWALESGALDANPSDAAGTGTGRPEVIAAGDGVGIVAWGEAGHVYTRRVTRTTPSAVAEQADPASFAGWSEVAADHPSISAGGDSTYASVTFAERLSNGSATQSRVLMNRLHGSQYDGPSAADGAVPGSPDGADQPQTAVTEYGTGFVTSETDQTHQLFATTLGSNDARGQTARVDSLPNSGTPDAVPATAGLVSNLIAWQQTPGVAGTAEIRVRYAADGSDLGPEQVVSDPSLGASDAHAGLVAAGDVSGDAAIAWVQGSGTSTRIVAAQLFQAPGGFVASNSFRWSTTAAPQFMWSGAAELWGPPTYVLRVDGAAVAQTTAGQVVTPTPLSDGRHSYQLTAVNLAGLSSSSAPATIFIDTVAPRATWKLTGTSIVNTSEHLRVAYTDPPPTGLPRTAASGVDTVYVKWGDGSPKARIRRTTASHVYKRIGTYTITLTIQDRAGNTTVITHKVKIKAKPKPKKKKRRKAKKAHTARATARGQLVIDRPGARGL